MPGTTQPADNEKRRRSVTLPASLWDRIKVYRHKRMMDSETDAIRELIEKALKESENEA